MGCINTSLVPFAPIEYLLDTRHLSPLRHGIYLLLLIDYWQRRGPLPLDEQELAGLTNCRSADEIEALRGVLQRYFVPLADGWYHEALQARIEHALRVSDARSAAGKLGAVARIQRFADRKARSAAKQRQISCKCQANDEQMPSNCQNDVAKPQQSRGTRLLVDLLPADWESWCRQARPDLNPHATFDRFADYWRAQPGAKGRKVDWAATWRNWCRNERPERERPTDVMALVAQLQREGR